ncbi:hypothetical protein LWF15_11710 [Kineosporia rhizophila]|uniref:hypothetical protein n=1 Tax=Kineosporia rhizophila TaxID=84633 RepID=UPI001E4DF049|nr:hypothetical protein [Kineosporia rhizophila]MCE0536177.1 hypothetical protein [Kineosporia rhizophila]
MKRTRTGFGTWTALTAPTALVVLLAGCGTGQDGATPQDGPGSVSEQMIGTWYAWDIPGYQATDFGLQTFDEAWIEFRDDGTWSASDGCNGAGGKYEVGADGDFSATKPGPQTAIGCANVPNDRTLYTSSKVAVVDGVLVLSNQYDNITGRYLREPQAAPSGTPGGAP